MRVWYEFLEALFEFALQRWCFFLKARFLEGFGVGEKIFLERVRCLKMRWLEMGLAIFTSHDHFKGILLSWKLVAPQFLNICYYMQFNDWGIFYSYMCHYRRVTHPAIADYG